MPNKSGHWVREKAGKEPRKPVQLVPVKGGPKAGLSSEQPYVPAPLAEQDLPDVDLSSFAEHVS